MDIETNYNKFEHAFYLPTNAFLFIRRALCADNPRSNGGFFRTKLVARFVFGVLVCLLSSVVFNDCVVPTGEIFLRPTNGDVNESSTAS